MNGFQCQRCGNCCRVSGVVKVSEVEVERLADFLEMDVYDFAEKYTELSPNRTLCVLTQQPDGACIFLQADQTCKVHPVKPEQCKIYPERWQSKEIEAVCCGLITKSKKDNL